MALSAFGSLSTNVSGAIAYGVSILFSFMSGLIPVVIFDNVPRFAPHSDLNGATIGFGMQGNNIGLLVGPVAAGAITAAHGWSAVPPLIALICLGAIALAVRMFSDHVAGRN
ncbi:hypothetical protein [Pseudorhodoplanes sinuspersici]|uniref:Major facilitator superfamily (MFS) profile domain-containing protein n=1 Tax=Pseudorhodoplanes sinuspersici TaxID=1235591 RepID=A0A1W6ZUW1_9HYPH|nr:hypothetical protein [Pseudorhodoplanes sinuspersici]ARQ01086.1 hypothetical protein CAK95_19790 [Pseudorhodoplanes sinuspersici]